MNVRSTLDKLGSTKTVDVEPVVAMMTLIIVWLTVEFTWLFVLPLKLMVLVGLIVSTVRTDPRFWCVMTALLGGSLAYNWQPMDNHQFVFVYISLALFCIFHVAEKDRREVMVLTGRYLLGVIMALAVVWKLISPDYLTGEFFGFTVLTRAEFAPAVAMVADITPDMLEANRRALQLLDYDHLLAGSYETVHLESTPAVAVVAQVLTWWTIGIEALIAALFLWPRRWGGDSAALFWGAHAALLIFLVTTYLVAPIFGFGWAVVVLGLMTCARRETLLRPIYMGMFVLLMVPAMILYA